MISCVEDTIITLYATQMALIPPFYPSKEIWGGINVAAELDRRLPAA